MNKGIKGIILVCMSTIFAIKCGYSARIMNQNPTKEDWECSVVDGEWDCKREKPPVDVFSDEITDSQRNDALAHDLSWVPKKELFIGGEYFNDTTFTAPLCESGKTDLSYENAEFNTDGTLIASGNVEVFMCDQEMYGDNAIINMNEDRSSIESVLLSGDVTAKQPSTGIIMRSQQVASNLTDGTYTSNKTYFRLYKDMPDAQVYSKNKFSGHMRGYANKFRKIDENNVTMQDGYITSGDPYDNDWKMSASNIDINTEDNVAYMKDGFFKIKDIPVFYLPYFSYPTNSDRRSGFLMPNIVQNDQSGYGVVVPYYFNLAPNYDFLFQQVYWSKRGPLENGTFRFMTDYYQGKLEGALVPYDFEDKRTRGAFSIDTQADWKNGFKGNFKYDYVSDSQFYNDFAAGDINLVTKTLLDRELDLSYNNSYIDSQLQFLDYGLVDQTMYLNNIPYSKLPEFKLNLTAGDLLPEYLSLGAETLNTYFYKAAHQISNTDTSTGTNIDGFRGYESPKIGYNATSTWGYFKPSLEVPIRLYALNSQANNTIQFKKDNVASVIPIFNIDSGLYFDRDLTTKDSAFTQSLEPRLFYTYIPYQDQSDIPLFDTNLTNEQYMQMFQVNRFTGHDRINNANQLTYALESNTVNQDDGSTLMSAKIGQQAFFADRKVTLCQGNAACNPQSSNVLFPDSNFSPIMTTVQYQILKHIYLSGQVNYRPNTQSLDYQVYQVQYKDENENVFNLSYNNILGNWNTITPDDINNGVKPPNQETITLSTILNITDTWGVAGYWNYNINKKQVADVFAAIQYDAKSWVIRGLFQTSAYTSTDPNNPNQLSNVLNNTYMLQLELKGLGGTGVGGGLSQRLSQINGYTADSWGS